MYEFRLSVFRLVHDHQIFVLQTELPTTNAGSVYHFDPLTIYDGSNDQEAQIAKLSGNLGSFTISSTGNSLFIKFESDSSNPAENLAGFLATIHFGNP